MANPLRHLRQLPWRSLIQAAGLTVLLVDLPLMLVLRSAFQLATQSPDRFPVMTKLLETLFTPPLGILVGIALTLGIGALSVIILERIDRTSIRAGSLWALVLCLQLAILLEQLLLIGSIAFNQIQLVGIMLGVFWRGRPYWRSFRRW